MKFTDQPISDEMIRHFQGYVLLSSQMRGGLLNDLKTHEWAALLRCALSTQPEPEPDISECIVGVGHGTGQLFVSGSYEAVKRVQDIIFENELRREALVKCRGVYYEYADNHTAKGTPEGYTKATRNFNMADVCTAAIDGRRS